MLKHEPENVTPQGKPQVYFTCHPEDHEKYFRKIYEDIRKYSNCVVWYSTDDEYTEMEYEHIKSMNLFVVPITTNLLTNPTCRTLRTDVPVALDNKKPVLPLMMEGGLVELFNKHFKNMHFLDPNAKEEITITYEEKLKKYLNSVLIGDELAEKVRAAFDAYIFLSYRKKDWKYRNELMHLIHKNELLRDIAIWYDGNLVAGEDFNQAIKDAIAKSDLFTMVVTPNLITDEGNYVRTEEYPTAINVKPVIPAEMAKTDHEKLSEWYPGIPECVDGRDEIVLSKELESALINIALKENDGNPQHNFFIGLAYLEGIDVEVDYKRALELITSAAEAKENRVPEAIEKLVSMYREGHGVERDYNIAAEWQQKLVDYWKEVCRNYNITDHYQNLLCSIEELGNQLYELRKLDEAEVYYRKILAFYAQLSEKTGKVEYRQNLSRSYYRLGNISEARGKLDEAEGYYRKSLVLFEQLAEETGTVESRRDLSRSYYRLGDISKARGKLDEAEVYYRQCIIGRALPLMKSLRKRQEQ